MTAPALYSEEAGSGVPVLLIHPAGSTASTWGTVVDDLARIGRVITYDRRGYARSGGAPPRSMSNHTADAAAVLERLDAASAVVVGTSAGAAIAVDVAVRRPDLVRAVVAHEFPWRFARHRPSGPQVAALAKVAGLVVRRRESDAAELLLSTAYSYRDGGSAWDAFPPAWRQAARDNAHATLVDFLNSIRNYPRAPELADARVPIVCSYGSRSPESMRRLVEELAAAIPGARARCVEGAGHAAPFDATDNFVALVAEMVSEPRLPALTGRRGSARASRAASG
jgi:pimeloyl-ACP methyl ester carboxylesterase